MVLHPGCHDRAKALWSLIGSGTALPRCFQVRLRIVALPHETTILFLEAVLRRVRTGVPWRDLPADFRNWASQLGRCRRWAASGVIRQVFAALSGDPDPEVVLVDGTIVPVHRKAAGAKGAPSASPLDKWAPRKSDNLPPMGWPRMMRSSVVERVCMGR